MSGGRLFPHPTPPALPLDGVPGLIRTPSPAGRTRLMAAQVSWMGKLLYRLNAGRHGGCPVLVFGIKPDVVEDWKGEL